MIAVIFEAQPQDGQQEAYLSIAAALRPELEKMDGFISIERFQSLADPGKLLSLSWWRDETAVAGWRRLRAASRRAARRAGAHLSRLPAAGRAGAARLRAAGSRAVAKGLSAIRGPGRRRRPIKTCAWDYSVRKIFSMDLPNSFAMAKASGRLGSYLPVSIALMVCRDTSSLSARSPWLQPRSVRSSRTRFFIA